MATEPKMTKLPENPGTFAAGEVGMVGTGGPTSERFDAVGSLQRSLETAGHRVVRTGDELRIASADLSLLPLVVGGIVPSPEGGVRTTTTVQVAQPSLFQRPVFEFQHAVGPTVAAALQSGFDQFVSIDLEPLMDALLPAPAHCHSMLQQFDASLSLPARNRRVVFGPVYRVGSGAADATSHDPGCPCCLLMNSLPAFRSILEDSDATAAIRLFAMRTHEGDARADCRINGVDFESGKDALRAYAASWPSNGVTFRKQYVIVQSLPGPGSTRPDTDMV